MLCPNCHSDQIIAVQDQKFCINCGQVVPLESAPRALSTQPQIKIGADGLPEGVTILGSEHVDLPSMRQAVDPPPTTYGKKIDSLNRSTQDGHRKSSLITSRNRIGADMPTDQPSAHDANSQSSARPKKRKVGRPKAGKLDVIHASAQAAHPQQDLSEENTQDKSEIVHPIPTSDQMHLSPKHPTMHAGKHHTDPPITIPKLSTVRGIDAISRKSDTEKVPPAIEHKQVHRVGAAPIHFSTVIGFVMRETFGRHHLALAGVSGALLGMMGGLGAWLYLTQQLPNVVSRLVDGSPKIVIEFICLAVLYYVSRNISQTAIIYGVSHSADGRPLGLARQFGIGVNLLSKRLRLDAIQVVIASAIAIAVTILFATGTMSWGIPTLAQYALIFCVFFALLYGFFATTITHGLATVALALTKQSPSSVYGVSWRLFKHRFELIGIQIFAGVIELFCAGALAAAALGLIVMVPREYSMLIAIGVGALAWLAGGLFGAGTATWWASVYRNIILLDHPKATYDLLSSRPPAEAGRLRLAGVITFATSILTVAILTPWLNLA